MLTRGETIRFHWLAQFFRYGLTGALNTVLSYASFAGLISMHLDPYLSQAIGYVVGMMTSFSLNAKWTFSRERLQVAMFVRFLTFNFLLLGLSEALFHLILNTLTTSPLIAQAVTLVPITGLGFVLNRWLVFTDSTAKSTTRQGVPDVIQEPRLTLAPELSEAEKLREAAHLSEASEGNFRALQTPFVSVVIPVFNEAEVVAVTCLRLRHVLHQLQVPYELLFVNDGSSDETLLRLSELSALYADVKVINFSRNFGHQIAATAGMDYATGDVVILIDADLQDPPELISQFLEQWRAGYDVVYAVRTERQGESWFKKWTSKRFYRILQSMTDVDIPLDTGDFRLMSRAVVDSLKQLPERHRFIRGLVSWVGYRQIGIPYVRAERYAGSSKYPLRKMIKFSVDGITSFSFKPLQFATTLGFFVAVMGFLFALVIIVEKLFTKLTVQGWTSMMVVVLFLGGIQLILLGVMGEYVGRIYDEVRGRPLYLVRETQNFSDGRK